MKTINALRIENLTLPEEMSYYYFVIQAVAAYSIAANRFAQAFAIFRAAYDYQNELYLRHDRKILTQTIQEKETLRDKWFRKLRNNVREVCEFGSGEKLEAARILSTIIEEYGGAKVPDMKAEAETGVLLNLYEDLQEKYPERVELLGLTPVVEGAAQANQEFIEAQNARLQSDADYGKGKMEAARLVTAKKYRYFIDSVNLEAEIDDEGELTPFIDYMNAKIDEMRRLAGQGPATGGGSSSEDDSEGGGEKPVFRTATFRFADGDTVGRRVEVGTPLIAPDNTPGYVWRPEVPELMPRTNRTFHEVPIVTEEVTATFHFADHTEEELRQHPGTELTAPANTQGYRWDPSVPALMPAEDTSYYEQPSGNAEDEGLVDDDEGGGTTGGTTGGTSSGSGGGSGSGTGGSGNNPGGGTTEEPDDL